MASSSDHEGRSADAILGRLRDLASVETDTALAVRLGVPYSTLTSWKRRNSVPLDAVVDFCLDVGSSLDWIYLGSYHQEAHQIYALDEDALNLAGFFALEFVNIKWTTYPDFGKNLTALYALVMSQIDTYQKGNGLSRDEALKEAQKWLERFATKNGAGKAQMASKARSMA